MIRAFRYVANWLRRPQRTRADDLLVAVVFTVLLWATVYIGGRVLDAIGLISFDNAVPIWVAALAGGVALVIGLLLGRNIYRHTPQTHELYTEHLRDALGDLRRLASGGLPGFSLRDYIENGLFQPAHRLLTTRGRDRGDVRFSILHPDAKDPPQEFTMSDDEEVYPAYGHSMDARNAFRIGIDDSFSAHAYRTGRTHVSNNLRNDERWKPHPSARGGREYESIVSVPLIRDGKVDGVINVIATRSNAFQPIDQAYIVLLAAVIDVARSFNRE